MSIEDYTIQLIEEQGTYRAFPLQWTLEQADSGAIALAIRFGIYSKWQGKEHGWGMDYPAGWYTDHRAWIVKKPTEEQSKRGLGGSLNDKAIENLSKCGLWDGDFEKLDQPPPRVFVHVEVEPEEYQGTTRWRANWVNPDGPEPKPRGQFAPVDRSLLDKLRAQHQAKTRALAGGGGASGTAPATPPPPPPQFGTGAAPSVQPAGTGAPAALPASSTDTAQPAPANQAPTQPPSAAPAPQAPPPAQPPAWGAGPSTPVPGAPPAQPPPPAATPAPGPPPGWGAPAGGGAAGSEDPDDPIDPENVPF